MEENINSERLLVGYMMDILFCPFFDHLFLSGLRKKIKIYEK